MVTYPESTVNYFVYTANRTPVRALAPMFGSVVKAISELPTAIRRGKQLPKLDSPNSLQGRLVPGNALSDFWLSLPDLLDVRQVSMILRGALAGNMWQAKQLDSKMEDTWPTYKKAKCELRTAV